MKRDTFIRVDEMLNADNPEIVERVMIQIITDKGKIIAEYINFIPEIIKNVLANKFWLAMKRKGQYEVYENGNRWEYETTLEDAVKVMAELLS